MNAQPGSYLRKTVDCFTRPGAVQLVNEDKDQLMADYLRCVDGARGEASFVAFVLVWFAGGGGGGEERAR